MASNYNMKYNFGKYQRLVQDFLNKLLRNSIQQFGKQVSQGKVLRNQSNYYNPNYRYELEKTKSFVVNVEEFLYYNYINNKSDFYSIFNCISDLEAISVLDDTDRGIYGQFLPATKIIQINPYLHSNNNLNSSEITRLYVSHELGHMINNRWMKSVTQFLRNDIKLNQKDLFYAGFSLIDEATTQDRAEDIAYYYAKKKRQKSVAYKDTRGMYDGKVYKTNFAYYGELQEPAIHFGRTLRGIGKIENEEEVMRALSKRALKSNFANKIIEEYSRDGQIDNLYLQFQLLGTIKKASYARFGYDRPEYLKLSKISFEELIDIAKKMRDYREPFE